MIRIGVEDENSQGREQLGGSSQRDLVSATGRGSHPRPAFTRGGVARLDSTSVFGRAFAVRVSRRRVPTRGEADSDAETPLLRLVEALVQRLLGIGQAPQRRRPGGQRIGAITQTLGGLDGLTRGAARLTPRRPLLPDV